MKMASWGFCDLVYESSGELADRPQETECGVPYSSGTKFVVGRSMSCKEAVGASTGAPMEIPSSFVALVCSILAKLRPSDMNSLFQMQLVMVHFFLRLAMCQQRPK